MDQFRKHVRLELEAYEKGWYFVTIVASFRKNLFQSQVAKKILEVELANIPARFSGWNIDETIIMPNHLHSIWWSGGNGEGLSRVVAAFKSLVAKRFREEVGYLASPWQPNYYEHIIRTEAELLKVRLYIRANPFEEKVDWSKLGDYI